MEPQPLGVHALTHITSASFETLNNAVNLLSSFHEVVREFELAAISQPIIHQFQPHGLTGIILLAESHISIHTWPERGEAAIDVFTCGTRCSKSIASRFAILVGADSYITNIIQR